MLNTQETINPEIKPEPVQKKLSKETILLVGLTVAVIIVLGIVAYTSLKKNGSILPSKDQTTPSNSENVTGGNAGKLSQVKAFSTYPKYTLTLNNIDDIVIILKDEKIFGAKYTFQGANMGETPLVSINFILKDKKVEGYDTLYKGNIYAKVTPGNAQFYDVESASVLDSPKANDTITREFFGAAFALADPKATNDEIDTKVDSTMKALAETGREHFVVSKN